MPTTMSVQSMPLKSTPRGVQEVPPSTAGSGSASDSASGSDSGSDSASASASGSDSGSASASGSASDSGSGSTDDSSSGEAEVDSSSSSSSSSRSGTAKARGYRGLYRDRSRSLNRLAADLLLRFPLTLLVTKEMPTSVLVVILLRLAEGPPRASRAWICAAEAGSGSASASASASASISS